MTVRKIKSIGDIPYPIDTHSDAFSPLLTAGAALGITGNDAEESAWLARTSTADGVASVRSIHGRTLRWNQLVSTQKPSSTQAGITTTNNGDGSWTLNGTAESDSNALYTYDVSIVPTHKYLMRGCCPAGGSLQTYYGSFGGAAADFGSGGIWTNASYSVVRVRIDFKAGVSFNNVVVWPQAFDLTAMFGAGNEPSTVAEFEALYPLPYYEYDAGSLMSVNMTGIESTGFNQWDEEWEVGEISDQTGQNSSGGGRIRAKNFIPCFANTSYYLQSSLSTDDLRLYYYDADKGFIGHTGWLTNGAITTPAGCRYMRFATGSAYGATYKGDICINISDPTRNGTYEPYWHQTRTIPAGILRGAGTVYDEQTATERIVRVGEVVLSEISWTYDAQNKRFSSPAISTIVQTIDTLHPLAQTARLDVLAAGGTVDAVDGFTVASGKIWVSVEASAPTIATSEALNAWLAANCPTMHVALATPTTTPIDPPLNMTYRTATGGTERVMVPTGELSAPPTIVAAQGYTAESLRDAALSAIAPVENGLASTNYGVGSYLVHGGQLCKVTTAIATGESITIGTNVTATTVMTEILSLVQ